MNIRDLQYIVAVARLGHFGKAAEACHVSQPTLSGQIKKLEEQLGVQIFERTNRRVVATDTGLHIIAHARQILAEVGKIKELAKSAQDPLSGECRLGAFPTLASYIFPRLVMDIKAVMPDLRLILLEEKTDILLARLRAGDIDAALLALPIEDESLHMQALFEDEFVLAVPADHVLSRYKHVSQDVLTQYPLLLLEEGHCLRDQALDVCRRHHLNEEQDFRATSLETLRQMVKAGTGLTFMPKVATREDDKGICYIPFTAPAPKRTIGLVWRKTSSKDIVMRNILEIWDASDPALND